MEIKEYMRYMLTPKKGRGGGREFGMEEGRGKGGKKFRKSFHTNETLHDVEL